MLHYIKQLPLITPRPEKQHNLTMHQAQNRPQHA